MGIFGLILMFAPAIGPTLSGWIVEHYDWRMLFHFVTPIAGAILIIGFFLLKDKKERVDIRLDFFSLLLSSIGFGGLLYGFSAAGQAGWGSPAVYGTIAAGAASLVWFILRQAGKDQPMLNFGVFRYSMFALSSVITMVLNIAMFSGILLLPIYVQTIRGISPFDAGLMLLQGALLNAALSPITGRLFDKFGAKMLAVIGLLDVMVTTYLFSRLTLTTGYYELMILNAVRMMGISMVMMPVSTNGLNQLPRKLYPHGTAMNNTLNQVSAALGTAAMVTIMSMRQETYAEALAAENGITGAPLPDALTAVAMMEGINDAFLVSSFVAGLAVLLALFIRSGSELRVQE